MAICDMARLNPVSLSLIALCLGATQVSAQLVNINVAGTAWNMWNAIQKSLYVHMPACNEVNHHLWRAAFHDCGTFNKYDNNGLGSGGCDGSLQYELNRPENVWAKDVILLLRNTITTTKLNPLYWLTPLSMADMLVLGGLMSLKRCGGPAVTFTPGRKDAFWANKENLLPGPFDSLDLLKLTQSRIGFTNQEWVTIIGAGHTIGDHTANMDSTPFVVDNKYFGEVMAGTADLILPSDANLLKDATFRGVFTTYKGSNAAFLSGCVPATVRMMDLVPRTSYTQTTWYRSSAGPVAADGAAVVQQEAAMAAQRADGWLKQLKKEQTRNAENKFAQIVAENQQAAVQVLADDAEATKDLPEVAANIATQEAAVNGKDDKKTIQTLTISLVIVGCAVGVAVVALVATFINKNRQVTSTVAPGPTHSKADAEGSPAKTTARRGGLFSDSPLKRAGRAESMAQAD